MGKRNQAKYTQRQMKNFCIMNVLKICYGNICVFSGLGPRRRGMGIFFKEASQVRIARNHA